MSNTTPKTNEVRELMLDATEINTRRGAIEWAESVYRALNAGRITEAEAEWVLQVGKEQVK
jgi:phage I-like protein